MGMFLPLLALACVGLGHGGAPEARLLGAAAAAIALGFALIYVGDLRYKQPFEFLLFPLAGRGGLRLWTRLAAGRAGRGNRRGGSRTVDARGLASAPGATAPPP